jgi:hypothetical protein
MAMPKIGALFPIYAAFQHSGNSAQFQHDAASLGKMILRNSPCDLPMLFRPGARIASNDIEPMPEEDCHERPCPD